MKMTLKSKWDTQDLGANGTFRFIDQLIRLDRANRRKKKALRQMNKALQRKNKEIEELEDYIDEII